MKAPASSFGRSPERQALLALYAEVDALLGAWSCSCSPAEAAAPEARCCHFAVTGREPYPTALELAEVHQAMRSTPPGRPHPKSLPMAALHACPLLSPTGRCRIYASRPFGCRTFFCDHAEDAVGAQKMLPRAEVNALGRRLADLSARFAPRDPGPRPLVKALGTRTK